MPPNRTGQPNQTTMLARGLLAIIDDDLLPESAFYRMATRHLAIIFGVSVGTIHAAVETLRVRTPLWAPKLAKEIIVTRNKLLRDTRKRNMLAKARAPLPPYPSAKHREIPTHDDT